MRLKHRKRLLRLASLLDRLAACLRRYVKAQTPKRSAIKTIKLEELAEGGFKIDAEKIGEVYGP